MHLRSRDGDRLELNVLGYQFPSEIRDEYDANWLQIEIRVATARGSWRAVDPMLLTTEVASLIGWLESLASNTDYVSRLEFLEPNLSFECVARESELVCIRAWFELEARPSWAEWNVVPARDLSAELHVTSTELDAAASDLASQLARYPPR